MDRHHGAMRNARGYRGARDVLTAALLGLALLGIIWGTDALLRLTA